MTEISHPLSPQDCLVAVMIAVSASDESLRTSELVTIERAVNHYPVFRDYDQDRIAQVSAVVLDLFAEDDGIEALMGILQADLPEKLYETAYALACDVAAADGHSTQGELRFLEELRYVFEIDRLIAGAIERGARARHLTL